MARNTNTIFIVQPDGSYSALIPVVHVDIALSVNTIPF